MTRVHLKVPYYRALTLSSNVDVWVRLLTAATEVNAWALVSGTYYSGGSRISPRRGRQLPRGAPTYDFAKFFQKPHEIERIWTPRGGARPKFYYVDPPLY